MHQNCVQAKYIIFSSEMDFEKEQIIFINVDCLLNPCVKVFEMFVDR